MPGTATWWTYIPTFATPLIGLVALYFAWRNIANARRIARDKATLDLIEKRESTEHYRNIHETFRRLRAGQGFAHLSDASLPRHKRERRDVVDYLNHYELVAIGVQSKILDAGLYQKWMLGPFVRDWNAAREWIQRERWEWDGKNWQYRSAVFQHYQDVACSWSPDALRLDRDSFPPPDAPAGFGDEPLPRPVET